jgi:hypothetical protein
MSSFKFTHKYKVFEGDLFATASINANVPQPDAQVDIKVALKEFRRDVRNVNDIYSRGATLSVEGNWRIILNHRDWAEFLSVRHPNPMVREQHKLARRAINAIIQRNEARVEKHLARWARC